MTQSNLPDGPTSVVRNTSGIARRPFEFYREVFAKYGETVRIPTFNGDVVVTRAPLIAKQILAQQPETYKAFATQALIPLIGPNSLLTIDGAPHKQERKLMMPPFHGARMKAYGDIIEQAAMQQMARWPKNKIARVQDVATHVSMEIILRAVFGLDGKDTLTTWTNSIRETVEDLHPAFLFVKALQTPFFGLSPWDKFKKRYANLEAKIYKEIDTRVETASDREDILSLLLSAQYDDDSKMSREALRDQLMTLLVAGHETTALSLSWAMYHIHQHEDVLARLQSELADVETPLEMSKLPYLKAVVQEVLRIQPVIPDIIRVLDKPIELGEYTVDKGMCVGISICGMHEREDLYETPRAFNPEHFMDKSYKPWEYLPFGGGHRRCIGAAFASFEMAIVLGTWLKHHTFALKEPLPVPSTRRGLTLGPKTGVRMMRL